MPIRISFQLHWLLVCLCLITITGCFFKATPDHENLGFYEDTLPNITISRRVVPEVGYQKSEIYGSTDFVKVESESRFGDPGEEPDLSCIYTGLREALPRIDIIPTSNFWEQIDASQDAVELTELFATPQSDRLRALQTDVLVIAYHARIDLSYAMAEGVFEGGYQDIDRETATIVVVDLNRKTIIHGSSISFEDFDSFIHVFFVVPLILSTREPFDICNTVARQAGIAIAETMPDRPIRALVVVAGEEPMRQEFDKKRQEIEEERRRAENRKHAEKVAQELAKLELEATKGNTDAQLNLFKEIYSEDPNRALRWLCKSADLGNEEARSIMAKVYEYGGYIWIKKGDIQQNYKLAYVWYALPGIYDEEDLQFFADRHLTVEELSEAKNLLREWTPGQCEKDLGLVS